MTRFDVASWSFLAPVKFRKVAAVACPKGVNGVRNPDIGAVRPQMPSDLQQAADVSGEYRMCIRVEDVSGLALADVSCHIRLRHCVTSCGPAAHLALPERH